MDGSRLAAPRRMLWLVPASRLLFAGAVALAAPACARAATFYVDPAGSDTASGLSPQAPWRSVARVNQSALRPGDVVRFRGGGVWREMLSPRASGTAAARITFTTYGDGRAVLDGGSGFAAIEANGQAFLDFTGFELANRLGSSDELVYVRGAHDVRFSGLDLHDAREGFHSSPSSASARISIADTTIRHIVGGEGSSAINLPVGDVGWTVSGTTIAGVDDSCVVDQSTGSTYVGDRISSCGFAVTRYGTHALYMKGLGQTVRDSELGDARTNCISARYGGVMIDGVRLHGCPIGIGFFNDGAGAGTITIRRAEIWNAPTGIYIDPAPDKVVRIANTTILAEGTTYGPQIAGIAIGSVLGARIENTIVAGHTPTPLRVDGTGGGGYVERANDFFSAIHGALVSYRGVSYHGYAAYRAASGQGAGSTSADPLLRATSSAAPDLYLSPASPLANTGVASPATGGLTPGCDGAPLHYCGAAPEPGAHELLPSTARPAPPAGLVATASTASVTLSWVPLPATRYRVYRAGVLVATVATGSATIGPLRAATGYGFGVAALDAAGGQSSPVAVAVSTLRTPDRTPPPPPPQLRVTALGPGFAELAFDPSTDANGIATYVVEGGGLASLRVGTAHVHLAGLVAGRTYAVTVRALDGAGNLSARTRAAGFSVPRASAVVPRVVRAGRTTLLVAIPRLPGRLRLLVGRRRLVVWGGRRVRVVRLRSGAQVTLRLEQLLVGGRLWRSRAVVAHLGHG